MRIYIVSIHSIRYRARTLPLYRQSDLLYIDDGFTVKVSDKNKRIYFVLYHRSLQCLMAVKLKSVDFESEFVSKMDKYLETLDRDHRKPNENPLMGIILCPSADRAEVEYNINRSMSPTMVAEYIVSLFPAMWPHALWSSIAST